MNDAEFLIQTLPDPESARRFLHQLEEKHRAQSAKLRKKEALLSDALTLVSYSPLLAATLLQNPEYLWWLERERKIGGVRGKDDLLESLARFSLTHSQVGPQILLARFRRRELMRIFLSDIRRLATIAEITEDISNLADAILEYALRIARQELDNRYGTPLETDEKGRTRPADFTVVALGKLGSKELNYSSDIDLLFLYSAEGKTSDTGVRGSITNREYFIKLAEAIVRLVGQQTGEGAAYRVDMRLRPHGRVGPLAISVADASRYYTLESRNWERQVLIRSRSSAGNAELYKQFAAAVETAVFSPDETVENALGNVRLSKQQIDLNRRPVRGYDVKLDPGGIREIEFIAQALQLAYGGRDKWLRAPHTLISLVRLADRKLLTERELTALFDAYEFLRHLEHILQMENGLQTHLLPGDPTKRELVSARMGYQNLQVFEDNLEKHTASVAAVFARVFSDAAVKFDETADADEKPGEAPRHAYMEMAEQHTAATGAKTGPASRRFSDLLRKFPQGGSVEAKQTDEAVRDYCDVLSTSVSGGRDFGSRLAALRRTWQELLAEIVALDLSEKLPLREAKSRQSALAEASIDAALEITKVELASRLTTDITDLPLAVLGLGKLGGGGIDYDSDLDIVLVYDEKAPTVAGLTPAEFYSRAAEIFVTTLSGVTRDGSLYRVDLRLRPYGKNGTSVISRTAFADYMRGSAAIWELLAYVKLRASGGDMNLGSAVENEIRDLIYQKAALTPPEVIAHEALQIRLQLERERSRSRRTGEIDIKYGSGGMLDVYFAMRFLQLRDGVPDEPSDRSTDFMLRKLRDAGSLPRAEYEPLFEGYRFLSRLDHAIRLIVGRTTRVPLANREAIRQIASRMHAASPDDLVEHLALHRLNIRASFDHILPPQL